MSPRRVHQREFLWTPLCKAYCAILTVLVILALVNGWHLG